jgi:hypothetical protein
MDNCCCSMNKYLLFFANFIFFIVGLIALGLGIFALVDGESLGDFLEVIDPGKELKVPNLTLNQFELLKTVRLNFKRDNTLFIDNCRTELFLQWVMAEH